MSVTTVKISGREYVLLPRKDYDKLTQMREDRLDAATAKRAIARLRSGKSKAVPLATVKKELGL